MVEIHLSFDSPLDLHVPLLSLKPDLGNPDRGAAGGGIFFCMLLSEAEGPLK